MNHSNRFKVGAVVPLLLSLFMSLPVFASTQQVPSALAMTFKSGFPTATPVASTESGIVTQNGRVLYAPAISRTNDESPLTLTLQEYLREIGAYDLDKVQITKESIPSSTDPVCGSSYYIDIKVHGFWNHVQAQMDFYVQTLTQESQSRLYNALKANYATQGLPQCLLNDRFVTLADKQSTILFNYAYDPDFTTISIPADWMPVPASFGCKNVDRPVTQCWNVTNPYAQH